MAPSVGNVSLSQNFAKVKYGEMIADMRGKINGTVHSRNRGGAYMRNLSIPSNPRTAAQSAVRSALAGLSAAFRALTQSQISAWNSATSDFPSINVFGASINPTGLQLYVGVNRNIQIAGGSAISNPPLPVGAAALVAGALTVNITGSVGTLAFTPDPVPADHTLVIEATRPLSPGISNPGSAYRQITTVAAAGPSPADIWDDYVARFGAPAEGQKIFVRARLIRTDTGEVSQRVVASTIVIDQA